jgi:hypothetical protein
MRSYLRAFQAKGVSLRFYFRFFRVPTRQCSRVREGMVETLDALYFQGDVSVKPPGSRSGMAAIPDSTKNTGRPLFGGATGATAAVHPDARHQQCGKRNQAQRTEPFLRPSVAWNACFAFSNCRFMTWVGLASVYRKSALNGPRGTGYPAAPIAGIFMRRSTARPVAGSILVAVASPGCPFGIVSDGWSNGAF